MGVLTCNIRFSSMGHDNGERHWIPRISQKNMEII